MNVARPIIGVTGPDRGGWAAWILIRFLVFIAGGQAIRILPNQTKDAILIQGLVLTGGVDIHPSRYREKLFGKFKKESRTENKGEHFLISLALWLLRKFSSLKRNGAHIDEARDEMEFRLLEMALKQDVPVLGICRGCQLINVFFGGSLHQNIERFYIEEPKLHTIRPHKTIKVESGNILARFFKQGSLKVNALHDQAINVVAEGLRVCARESNGVVQAIEHPTYKLVLGLQWHPEFMPLHREQRMIFQYLVGLAREADPSLLTGLR